MRSPNAVNMLELYPSADSKHQSKKFISENLLLRVRCHLKSSTVLFLDLPLVFPSITGFIHIKRYKALQPWKTKPNAVWQLHIGPAFYGWNSRALIQLIYHKQLLKLRRIKSAVPAVPACSSFKSNYTLNSILQFSFSLPPSETFLVLFVQEIKSCNDKCSRIKCI